MSFEARRRVGGDRRLAREERLGVGEERDRGAQLGELGEEVGLRVGGQRPVEHLVELRVDVRPAVIAEQDAAYGGVQRAQGALALRHLAPGHGAEVGCRVGSEQQQPIVHGGRLPRARVRARGRTGSTRAGSGPAPRRRRRARCSARDGSHDTGTRR